MKNIIIVFFTLNVFFSLQVKGQNLPNNPQPDKCYIRCFDLDKRWDWKEVDCNKKKSKALSKKEQLLLAQQYCLELKTYQRKLIVLGYKLEVSARHDKATTKAHHKYLNDKAKYEKRRKKAAKRLTKKNVKPKK